MGVKMEIGLVLLAAILIGLSSNMEIRHVNVHTCRYEQGQMTCEWTGPGLYQPDRSLVGVKRLILSRFFQGSYFDAATNMPDLQEVFITNGDATCDSVIGVPTSHITIANNPCQSTAIPAVKSTSLSPSSSPHSSSSSDSETMMASGSDTEMTSIKLSITTTDAQTKPDIQTGWKEMTEVKVLVIVLIAILCHLVKKKFEFLFKKKRNYRPRRQSNNNATQTEDPRTPPTTTSLLPVRRSNRISSRQITN